MKLANQSMTLISIATDKRYQIKYNTDGNDDNDGNVVNLSNLGLNNT